MKWILPTVMILLASCTPNPQDAQNMISRDSLPEDAADWNTVAVDFARLTQDSEASCPAPMEDVMEYVRMESADTDNVAREQLQFLWTAKVGAKKYWIWKLTESDGTVCYVHVSLAEDGGSTISLSEANGLTPEQFILADYYDEIYW